jgi:cGMP-dependent protein kinase
MENDFLKNLDATQVREIVESMYPREFEKGSYVIREGDAGMIAKFVFKKGNFYLFSQVV